MSEEKPPSEINKYLTWRVKPRERPPSGGIVPMIPASMWGGSSFNEVEMNPLVKHALTNPFVPVGMIATVGCLVGMLNATLKRNQYRAQLYMRGRVAAQFFTVCVLVGGAVWMGFRSPFGAAPGVIPGTPDVLTKKLLHGD